MAAAYERSMMVGMHESPDLGAADSIAPAGHSPASAATYGLARFPDYFADFFVSVLASLNTARSTRKDQTCLADG